MDSDFANACSAIAISDFVAKPYESTIDCKDWQSCGHRLAWEISAEILKEQGTVQGVVQAAFERAKNNHGDSLAVDVLAVMKSLDMPYTGPNVTISNVFINECSLDDFPRGYDRITFSDCMLVDVYIESAEGLDNTPKIQNSILAFVSASTENLYLSYSKHFSSSEVLERSLSGHEPLTTNKIMDLELPRLLRVVLTVLKKIFAQRGTGRKEVALFRGLDAQGRELVPEALELLRKHGFITEIGQNDQRVWHAAREAKFRRRALSLLANPRNPDDPIVLACVATP